MLITNRYKTELQLPDGTVLPPGVETSVPDWDILAKRSSVLRAWAKSGVLSVAPYGEPLPSAFMPDIGDEVEPVWLDDGEPQEEPAKADDKDSLRAELDARGIEYDKRWGVERLRAALEGE